MFFICTGMYSFVIFFLLQVFNFFLIQLTTNVQTETIPVKEVGVQVNLPPLTAEDLEGDDQKTRFYTGFVNFGTFMLIFNNLLQVAGKLNYWNGKDSLPSRSNHTLKTKTDTNLGPNERCG